MVKNTIYLIACFLFCCNIYATNNKVVAPFLEMHGCLYTVGDTLQDKVNPVDNPSNPIDLKDPKEVTQEVEYDPATNTYTIYEKLGENFIRSPYTLSFDEYMDLQNKKTDKAYWENKAKENASYTRKGLIPELYVGGELFDRIFGGTTVDIRPQGNIDLTFGGNYQKVENPTLTERQRRNGGFDFGMNIQLNLVGQIGEKLKLSTNYNTKASFDFENQMKLEYTGFEDEIIQKIEAGNVSLPLRTSLISGSQSLFGVKTELKFGRLSITSLVSQQKSKADQINIQGGTQLQTFNIPIDQYDENRHFFLTQYNRDNYNLALKDLPKINSLFQIQNIEIWVTNSNTITQGVRDIVALADLGETEPNDPAFDVIPTPNLPSNDANTLFGQLNNNTQVRQLDLAENTLLNTFNQTPVQDFEIVRARQLKTTEYTFSKELGYISLNINLQPDEVLGVAFEYIYNGEVYQVGQFSRDVPVDPDKPNVLFVKMLKSTSARPELPIWDLMMKNVYSLGAFQVNNEDFRLNISYRDPGGGEKPYLPEGAGVQGKILTQLLNLDGLNRQNDPQPDGEFDFVPGVTILPKNGRLIFPVVEPFGDYLRDQFQNNTEAEAYVYDELYDTTITAARQFPEKNRYNIQGSYKSSSSSEISLGTFNIPEGSVRVTGGGRQLTEGVDYTVDYNLGRIKILNEGVLNSGVPVKVSFENSALFGIQTKTLFGTRLDYWISDDFTLGATYLHLRERPFTQKINIGDDPIANSMYGFDFNYTRETPWITKMVDKIPLIDTKEPSSVTVNGEIAYLDPGHSGAIGEQGIAYIDDFEGSSNNYDLKFPLQSWVLASTPQDNTSTNPLFPEANLINDRAYGFNRAKTAWYIIDPLFLNNNSATPDHITPQEQNDPYVSQIREQDVFPNAQRQPGQNSFIPTLDLAFYPTERGQYNYDTTVANLNPDGTFNNPRDRWGGIMRSFETNDFEASNVEFVEIWMMDPFVNGNGGSGGDMYLNLGTISEDVLRDSRKFYENGLPKPGVDGNIDTTSWGRVPNTQAITNAFDNDTDVRALQDVGFDGLNDDGEREVFNNFLNAVQPTINSAAFTELQNDPSSDNYHYFRGDDYDADQVSILDRYKRYNNTEGNSPTSEQSPESYPTAATNVPDTEDLNRDNTLTRSEEYFQYKMEMFPGMDVGDGYITDKATDSDGVEYYRMQIPVAEFTSKIGNIQDFRSIRFMRMFLTNFDSAVVCRFVRLQLVRNQWRRYANDLINPGETPGIEPGETFFNVAGVNIEENSDKAPVNYVIPPGIQREQSLGAFPDVLQNEQSMSIEVCNLKDAVGKAAFKTINLDMRRFKQLELFLHAESVIGETPMTDGAARAFIRLGSDFTENYYEYELPLTITADGETDPDLIWPEANLIALSLDSLRLLKAERNASTQPRNIPYTIQDGKGNDLTIVGNPDLGFVKTAMVGIRNPYIASGKDPNDIGEPICIEMWANELRLTEFDERGGLAALGRVDIKMADFANVTVSGNYTGIGWGGIEQKLNDRQKKQVYQYDISSNMELGKFLPKKSGIKIPLYAGLSRTIVNPEWDPYDKDIKLKDKLKAANSKAEKDSIKLTAQDYTSITSVNLSNVRKVRTNTEKKAMPWDIENWNATYSYSNTLIRNPLIESERIKTHFASLNYNYSAKAKYLYPFKKMIKKDKYLKIIKDINVNFIPSSLVFGNSWNRKFGEKQLRSVGIAGSEIDFPIEKYYDKDFTWSRQYGLGWDLTKSLKIDFNAKNLARIDEPEGAIDSKEKRDTIVDNLLKLGRTLTYNQGFNVNYKVPINKLPFLDFVQVKAKYGANYTWNAASLLADTLGNVIQNDQVRQINGDFDFTKLYNKSKFLKKINSPRRKSRNNRSSANKPNPKQISISGDDDKGVDKNKDKDKDKKKDKKKKKNREPSVAARVLLRPLMMIRKVTVNYQERYQSVLPGFMPKSKYLGNDFNLNAPGLGYVFGQQPSESYLDDAAANGWISDNLYLNQQVVRNYSQTIEGRVNLEPFKDFRIDLNVKKDYSENHTEYFKVADETKGFEHLAPIDLGSYTISYFSAKTAFKKIDASGISEVFEQFENNRTIISQRLGDLNPNSAGTYVDTINGQVYANGYGRNSQDVLIPSFIAAYSGQDAGSSKLNFFDMIPLPNWKLTYNGLSKISLFKKIFSSVNVTHGYNSTFTVNQYKSDLNFESNGSGALGQDSLTNNYYSTYEIPNIVITEQFSPLIGIDIKWKNSLSTRFDYKKSRNLSMNFVDNQLSEQKSKEFTVGLGYKLKGITLPFKFGGKKSKLENDINFKFDFSLRDDITINHQLDQNVSDATRGSKTIRISPSIDYLINNRLNIRIFFDRTRTIPATSASFPITATKGGVTIRFSLGQ